MFSGLKNEKAIKKIFLPAMESLEKSCLLLDSDKFAFRVLFERADDYISHLRERAVYMAEIKPEILSYEKRELETRLERLKSQLAIKEQKGEKDACFRLRENIIETEKKLYINSQQEKFKTLKLLPSGEIHQNLELSTEKITRELMSMLKENGMTNIARARIQANLKLETQQKSIADVLSEMLQNENESVLN